MQFCKLNSLIIIYSFSACLKCYKVKKWSDDVVVGVSFPNFWENIQLNLLRSLFVFVAAFLVQRVKECLLVKFTSP